MIDSLALATATRSGPEKWLTSFYLAITVHYGVGDTSLASVLRCALLNRSILSSVNPCTIRVSHTGNSRAEEPDLSIGDFLF